MSKKIFLTLICIFALCLAMTLMVSAATYYVDSNGNLVDADSDSIAYEYEITSKNLIPSVYLYDTSITKIVIPDMPEITGQIQLQGSYSASLGIYAIEDKEGKTNNLMAQIKEVVICENVYLDGAYNVGVFNGYTSLEKLSFYGKVSVAGKGGFFNNTPLLSQVHFYGRDITVQSTLINSLHYNVATTIVFHEGSSGTLATGAETLPTYGKLTDWRIIINPNIKPSNSSDPRLGLKWGTTTSTTGWELIVAVSDKSAYSEAELEAFKLSHGFCSRAGSLDTAVVKEASVLAWCELGYGEHSGEVFASLDGEEGYFADIELKTGCTKCGVASTIDTVEALFTSKGVSAKTFGGDIGLVQGYHVNTEAISKYRMYAPNFDFGILAYANKGGTAVAPKPGDDKVIDIVFDRMANDYVEVKVTGIPSDFLNTPVVFCIYVTDGERFCYLDNGVTSTTIIGNSYNEIVNN